MTTTRRSFLHGMGGLGAAATGLGAAGAAFARPARGKAVAPSDRIRVGAIGVRGMGSSNMGSMLDIDGVECAALCDVDGNVLGERVKSFEELTDSKPDAYTDYRKLLEDDEIDAVIIATPDHWHCKIMVDACEAGKDVYVEKPMANSIEEVRIMQQAARAYGRVVQVGQWQRSGKHWQDAMEYLWSGELGQVRTARAWAYMDWDAPVHVPDSKPPKGVDYDMWLGPAPKRPFNENRFHWNFRWYWDYAGGLMTDWGVHLIDMVLMGMKATAPKSVMSLGRPVRLSGRPDRNPGHPAGGLRVRRLHDDLGARPGHRARSAPARARRVLRRQQGHPRHRPRAAGKCCPKSAARDGRRFYKTPAIPDRSASRSQRGLAQHTEDFIECMKTREQPRCNADVGALVAVNAHLGNIAFRTGRRV